MAGNPAMRPHTEGTKGIGHTDIICSGNKGENPETTMESRTVLQQTNKGSIRMWTIEDRCLHRPTNTRSKHTLAEVQGNADQ